MKGPWGGSWQYLTRTAVVPAGTVKGTSTKLPCNSAPNSPVITCDGSISAPVQDLGPSAVAAAGALTRMRTAAAAGSASAMATIAHAIGPVRIARPRTPKVPRPYRRLEAPATGNGP